MLHVDSKRHIYEFEKRTHHYDHQSVQITIVDPSNLGVFAIFQCTVLWDVKVRISLDDNTVLGNNFS